MASDPITYRGGRGRPLLLVHGLMGRGSTWSRQTEWLTDFGAVHTYDAPWHRGRDAARPGRISTEAFVAELRDAAAGLGEPVTLVGHSMGALHSWCVAAQAPGLVRALVLGDMAPDFVGETTGVWEPWVHALPVEYTDSEALIAEFGPIAGRYFLEAFDRTETGWRLHGYPGDWVQIAAEWGTRDYWAQWRAVSAPALLLEAGFTVAPPGQMRKMAEIGSAASYVKIPAAGHLIHDDAPEAYRSAVSDFLRAT